MMRRRKNNYGSSKRIKSKTSEEKFYFRIEVSGETADVGLVLLTEAEAELVARVTKPQNWIVFEYGGYSGEIEISLEHKYPEHVITELCNFYSLGIGEFKDCREFDNALTYLENYVKRESVTWEQALSEWKADNCE